MFLTILYFTLGKGLIILLHGAPGVGKTSTAGESKALYYSKSRTNSADSVISSCLECVADVTLRPLYPITCGNANLPPRVLFLNYMLTLQRQSWRIRNRRRRKPCKYLPACPQMGLRSVVRRGRVCRPLLSSKSYAMLTSQKCIPPEAKQDRFSK